MAALGQELAVGEESRFAAVAEMLRYFCPGCGCPSSAVDQEAAEGPSFADMVDTEDACRHQAAVRGWASVFQDIRFAGRVTSNWEVADPRNCPRTAAVDCSCLAENTVAIGRGDKETSAMEARFLVPFCSHRAAACAVAFDSFLEQPSVEEARCWAACLET